MEWNDDEIKAEIRQAIKIAREDGLAKHIKGLHEKLDKLMSGSTDTGTGDPASGQGEGGPPPKTDPKESQADKQAKKRSLWWGEQ